jgi:hypothetical protein
MVTGFCNTLPVVDSDDKWTAIAAEDESVKSSKAGLQGAVSGNGIPVDVSAK